MVIDTSVILAILQREPERRSFIDAIEATDSTRMSVASFVESSMVIEARAGFELMTVDGKQGNWPVRLLAASASDVTAPG